LAGVSAGWLGRATTVTDAGWAHVHNTTMPVAISRSAQLTDPLRVESESQAVIAQIASGGPAPSSKNASPRLGLPGFAEHLEARVTPGDDGSQAIMR
jgi:hypothetical protein